MKLILASQLTDSGKVEEGIELAEAQLHGGTGAREVYLDLSQIYSRLRRFKEAEEALRKAEARTAVAALGLPEDRLDFFGLRDEEAPRAGPEFDAAVDRLAALMAAHGIATVCATWRHDAHRDHVAAHRIAAAAAARTGARLGCTGPRVRPG